MTYLLYIAVFGVGAVFFLWLRDIRIYSRTALPGYRIASRHGGAYGVLALLGLWIATLGYDWEIPGLGVILLALYLQGRVSRDAVWGKEGPFARFFGSVERRKDKGSEETSGQENR